MLASFDENHLILINRMFQTRSRRRRFMKKGQNVAFSHHGYIINQCVFQPCDMERCDEQIPFDMHIDGYERIWRGEPLYVCGWEGRAALP